MQIRIRAYRSADHDALAALYEQVRSEEFFWMASEQRSAADFDRATEGEQIFVAEIQGGAAGFVSVWEPDKFIHSLFVAGEFRRMGVGLALIQRALVEYGTPLTLKCVVKNENALQFYLKNGWRIEREDSGDEGPYVLLSLGKACVHPRESREL